MHPPHGAPVPDRGTGTRGIGLRDLLAEGKTKSPGRTVSRSRQRGEWPGGARHTRATSLLTVTGNGRAHVCGSEPSGRTNRLRGPGRRSPPAPSRRAVLSPPGAGLPGPRRRDRTRADTVRVLEGPRDRPLQPEAQRARTAIVQGTAPWWGRTECARRLLGRSARRRTRLAR